MLKNISALVAATLLLAGQAFAVSDAVVFDGGDVVINGGGTGLVFPDSSRQTTATLQGPAGPANTLSIGTVTTGASGSQAAASISGSSPNQVLNLTIPQGPAGPQGNPGVADGISKGVHGTIPGASSSGSGFSAVRSAVGIYDITFSPAFSGTPDCVISPVGHLNNGTTNTGYVACEVTAVSAAGATVQCKFYYFGSFPTLIDDTFTFICVK